MAEKVELLSPAKNAEIAKSAILAGADSVYIGASAFGARAAAANPVEDIEALCKFAHLFGCKVYVALNTILDDGELDAAARLAWSVYRAGADALIIQDFGLLECGLPPMPLHASTQCHLATPDKARFLEACGFDTIVVARELSLDEISEISKSVSCKIECFAHGALCVSYSGQCYLSHAVGGRSGNRGECAQPCRMPYSLENSEGKEVMEPAHYLSLRDMNRSKGLGEMLDAGVGVFKIEGRLKDAEYVKNITALYRKRLDAELEKRGVKKLSYGKSSAAFEPSAQKTFNRLFTEYHLRGTQGGNESFATPKARGEPIGTVEKAFGGGFFFRNASQIFSNGDGLFFESGNFSLGSSVQRVDGDRVLVGRPDERIFIPAGAKIWRNRDAAFEKLLKPEAVRKMPVNISIGEDGENYIFKFETADDRHAEAVEKIAKASVETAQNQEAAEAKLKENISKLGASFFEAAQIRAEVKSFPHMKPADVNALRRTLVEKLKADILKKYEAARTAYKRRPAQKIEFENPPFDCDYRANVRNRKAEAFYARMGFKISEYAPESGKTDMRGKPVMTTKHCILRELDMCKKENRKPENFSEPMYLKSGNIKLRLKFDCARCGMDIYKE